MTIILKDKTNVSVRYVKGQCMLSFHHSIGYTRIILKAGIECTIDIIQAIYDTHINKI